LFNSIL